MILLGNVHRKIGKDRVCIFGDMLADRQTDRHTHTDVLITILRHCSRGRSKNGQPWTFSVFELWSEPSVF